MRLARLLLVYATLMAACEDAATTPSDAAMGSTGDAAADAAGRDAEAAPDAAPAALDAGGGAPDAALKGFGETCASAVECADGLLCDRANMGLVCTAMCVNGACPVSATATCNMRNLCRP